MHAAVKYPNISCQKKIKKGIKRINFANMAPPLLANSDCSFSLVLPGRKRNKTEKVRRRDGDHQMEHPRPQHYLWTITYYLSVDQSICFS